MKNFPWYIRTLSWRFGFRNYQWFRRACGGDWYKVDVWGLSMCYHEWERWEGSYRGYSQVRITEEEHYYEHIGPRHPIPQSKQ